MDSIFFYIAKITWLVIALDSLLIIWMAVGVFCLLKQYLRVASVLLVGLLTVNIIIAAFPVGEWLMYPLEHQYPPATVDPAEYDGVIVLGGGQHNAVTHAWQQVALTHAGERSLLLLTMAQSLPKDIPIVFTGGNGRMSSQGISDSGVIKQLLDENNIPQDRVIFESQSRNTFENAVLSKVLVQPKADERWLLVTSAFHMPRSMAVFCKADWPVTAYPVDFRSRKDKLIRLDWGYARHLNRLNTAFREWVGILAYRINNKSC